MGVMPYDQRLASALVRPLARASIHPNFLTALSFALGCVAAYLFVSGDPANADVAALVFMGAVFADHMDGELARISGKTSRFGHYFDFLVGAANYTMLFAGIGLGLYFTGAGPWALWLGLSAGLANPAIVGLRIKMERRFGRAAVAHPAVLGFEIEDFIYLIGPITWLVGVKQFFILYGFGTLGYLAWTAGCYLHRRRESADAT